MVVEDATPAGPALSRLPGWPGNHIPEAKPTVSAEGITNLPVASAQADEEAVEETKEDLPSTRTTDEKGIGTEVSTETDTFLDACLEAGGQDEEEVFDPYSRDNRQRARRK